MQLDPKWTSTKAVEKSVRVEIIRDVSTAVAQVSGLDWQKVEDPISQASGLIGQMSTKQAKQIQVPIAQTSGLIGQLSTKNKVTKEESHSTVQGQNTHVPEQIEHISHTSVSEYTDTECHQPTQDSQS